MNSLGISSTFQESASYLSAFDFMFVANGLQLLHKGVTINLDFEKGGSKARVLSSPVIRVTAFQDFSFKTVDRIPYEQTVINEGVTTTSLQFIEAGFTLSGRLLKFSDHLKLDLNQSNGNPTTIDNDGVPTIEEQTITTSLDLRLDQWTVVGGVRTSRLFSSSSLLSRRSASTDDLLYIFVRPRDRVKPIPRAIPVEEFNIYEMDSRASSLLPGVR